MSPTKEELAARLNGRAYRHEITEPEEDEAKKAGLTVVFGYSDDNVELRGAINDEIGAYDGTSFRVCHDGLLPDWPEDLVTEVWAEDYFRRKAAGFQTIDAIWCPEDADGALWAYKTNIPHATFDVMEDGELYCRGIVFSLSDIVRIITS